MLAALTLAFLAAPLPADRFPLTGTWPTRAHRYGEALHPAFGATRANVPLLPWLRYVDPRPETEFTRFDGERLGKRALAYSAEWASRHFRDIANPHANNVPPCGYHLASEQYDCSLLLYEWEAAGYRFVMQESSRATLLRVRPGTVGFLPKTGIPMSFVRSLLRDLLGSEFTAPGRLREPIQGPYVLYPGKYATNTWLMNGPIFYGWENSVFALVTGVDVCVLVCKAERGEGRRTDPGVGIKDEFWLPKHLVTKDGKSLLIDRRDKVTPARPVPTDTVTIPAP